MEFLCAVLWSLLGTIWLVNLGLASALVLTPGRLVVSLGRGEDLARGWLRLLGVVVFANTAFCVAAMVMAAMYHAAVAESTVMPR